MPSPRGATSSIRLQILVLILLIGLPVAALAAYSGYGRLQDDQRATEEEALRLAQSYEDRVSTRIRGTAQLLGPIAALFGAVDDLSEVPVDACAPFFLPFTQGADLDLMGAMRPDGTLLCAQQELPDGATLAGRPYVETVLQATGAVIGTVEVSPVSGNPVLPVLFPIRNAAGTPTGALVAMMNVSNFAPITLLETLPEGSFATMTDGEGRIVSRYPETGARVAGQSITTSANFLTAQRDRTGVLDTTSADGVAAAVGFLPIGAIGENAYVFMGINKDERLAAAFTSLWRDSAVLLLLTGVAVGIAWVGTQRFIVGPVVRLQAAADRMAAGDLDTRVGPDYAPGELGTLGRAFDSMASAISARTSEINDLNATLEQRVATRTAELEATNRELEAFSYSVSHDLRSPLRAIDGFAELVTLELGNQMPEEAARYMSRVRGGTQRMGQLIDDLLQFSRVGRQEMTRRPFSMDAAVRESIEDLTQHQTAIIEWQIGELGEVVADRAMVRRVLDNLIGNAIKFSHDQAQPRVEIARTDGPDGPVFSVRDNGVGFDMAYADKLFGMFQRLHLQEEFEGTGVGLAIVQRVVAKHGGRVWAQAVPGSGATFYFTLGGDEATNDE